MLAFCIKAKKAFGSGGGHAAVVVISVSLRVEASKALDVP
jgi:hypothetical protein